VFASSTLSNCSENALNDGSRFGNQWCGATPGVLPVSAGVLFDDVYAIESIHIISESSQVPTLSMQGSSLGFVVQYTLDGQTWQNVQNVTGPLVWNQVNLTDVQARGIRVLITNSANGKLGELEAYARVDVQECTTLPSGANTRNGWVCLTNMKTPLRVIDGSVVCASNGTNCIVYNSCQGALNLLSLSTPTLACGKESVELTGLDGYFEGDICTRGEELLGPRVRPSSTSTTRTSSTTSSKSTSPSSSTTTAIQSTKSIISSTLSTASTTSQSTKSTSSTTTTSTLSTSSSESSSGTTTSTLNEKTSSTTKSTSSSESLVHTTFSTDSTLSSTTSSSSFSSSTSLSTSTSSSSTTSLSTQSDSHTETSSSSSHSSTSASSSESHTTIAPLTLPSTVSNVATSSTSSSTSTSSTEHTTLSTSTVSTTSSTTQTTTQSTAQSNTTNAPDLPFVKPPTEIGLIREGLNVDVDFAESNIQPANETFAFFEDDEEIVADVELGKTPITFSLILRMNCTLDEYAQLEVLGKEFVSGVFVNNLTVIGEDALNWTLIRNQRAMVAPYMQWKVQPVSISITDVSTDGVHVERVKISITVTPFSEGAFSADMSIRILTPAFIAAGLSRRDTVPYTFADLSGTFSFAISSSRSTTTTSTRTSRTRSTSSTSTDAETTAAAAVTTLSEEPTATEEPTVTTEEPTVTTEDPTVTTEEPTVTTEEPTVSTEDTVLPEETTTSQEVTTSSEVVPTQVTEAETKPVDATDPTLPTTNAIQASTKVQSSTKAPSVKTTAELNSENVLPEPTQEATQEMTQSTLTRKKSTTVKIQTTEEAQAAGVDGEANLPQSFLDDPTLPTFGIQAIQPTPGASTKKSTKSTMTWFKSSKSSKISSSRTFKSSSTLQSSSASTETLVSAQETYALAGLNNPTTRAFVEKSVPVVGIAAIVASVGAAIAASIGGVLAGSASPMSAVQAVGIVQGFAGLGLQNVNQSSIMKTATGGMSFSLGLIAIPGLDESLKSLFPNGPPVKKGSQAALKRSLFKMAKRHAQLHSLLARKVSAGGSSGGGLDESCQENPNQEGCTEDPCLTDETSEECLAYQACQESSSDCPLGEDPCLVDETSEECSIYQACLENPDSEECQSSDSEDDSTIIAVAEKAGIAPYAIFLTITILYLIVFFISGFIVACLLLTAYATVRKSPEGSKKDVAKKQLRDLKLLSVAVFERIWLIFLTPLTIVCSFQFYYASAYEEVPVWLTIFAAFVFIVFVLGIPTIIFYRMRFRVKSKEELEEEAYEKTMGVFYKRYSLVRWMTILFWVPVTIAEIISAMGDGGLFFNPYVQVFLNICAQLTLIIMFITLWPVEDKSGRILWLIATLANFISLLLMIPLLPAFDVSEAAAEGIGVAQIVLSGFGIGFALFASLFSIFWPMTKKVIKRYQRRKETSIHTPDVATPEMQLRPSRSMTRSVSPSMYRTSPTLSVARRRSQSHSPASLTRSIAITISDHSDDYLRRPDSIDSEIRWEEEGREMANAAKEEASEGLFAIIFMVLMFATNFISP
jgi:hypothetical protein